MVADHQGGEHQGRVTPSMASNVRFRRQSGQALWCGFARLGRGMTQSGHERAAFAAMHGPNLL